MSCDPVKYSQVDASQWACVKALIGREYGMHFESHHGEASQRGFTVRWAYDEREQTLCVECSNKPFFVPCGTVNKRIRDAAAECGIT